MSSVQDIAPASAPHEVADARLARILVVVDPLRGERPAVEKAARIAMGSGAVLELYLCDAEQSWSAAERALRQEQFLDMLEELAAPLRLRGIEVECRCEWSAPLEQGIALHAIRSHADLIVKDTHPHEAAPTRASVGLTDWGLIRLCQAPLLLVRPAPWRARPSIAVSLDPCRPALRPKTLDEALLSLGTLLTDSIRGSLQALHVLQSPPHLPGETVAPDARSAAHAAARASVTSLVERCREKGVEIPLHFLIGHVAPSMIGFVAAHDCDVLIAGAGARARWPQSGVSGTAAQVLEALPCDLLVVKPPGFVSPLMITDD